MDVSIVVTVLNEEGAVDELYARVAASLDGRDWEAIFVDDGSTDGTYAKLRALHERTRACASCASSATSASTRRCTPGSRARAARAS